MEGGRDPFNRRTYPWGNEDAPLLAFYRKLGRIRCENPVFADGDFRILAEADHAIAFERKSESGHVVVAANRGEAPFPFTLPRGRAVDLISGKPTPSTVLLQNMSFHIWRIT